MVQSLKRRLALVLLAGASLAACSAANSAPPKNNPNLLIVQIDEVTLGSTDPRLHQFVIPKPLIESVVKKLYAAGARTVVVDTASSDATATALDAVQKYTGRTIDISSLPHDANGQLKLDPVNDRSVNATTASGTQVIVRHPVFASDISFAAVYADAINDLKPLVAGKLVYLGYAAQGTGGRLNDSNVPIAYPKLFADARLADQVMSVAGRPSN
jgi:CHASE2 domain-containing sensor protein